MREKSYRSISGVTRVSVIAGISILCYLATVSIALAGYDMTRNVIGGSGGSASSVDYTMQSTIGQSLIGPSASMSYRLSSGFTTSSPALSVIVVSPNGGENWVRGTTNIIRWTYTGNPGSRVKIELLKGGVLNSIINSSTNIGVSGSGSYSWLINSTQTSGSDYKIRITSTSNPAYTDTSNNNFTISTGITVISPNGGEIWTRGTTQTIRWTYSGSPGSYVKIELLKSGVLNRVINSSTKVGVNGSGSYNWLINSTQTLGSDYKVRITSATNPSYTDTSNNNFTISTGITVTSPNGGENWVRGTTQTIRWTYSGSPGSYVKIELLKGGVLNRIINSSTRIGSNGSGSYNWLINSTQTLGSDYKVRVTSTSNPAYTDTSNNNFTISIPSITVASPNGGENWARGTTQTIRWTYSGSPGSYVKIELLKSGVLNRVINSSTKVGVNGSGSYSWLINSTQTLGSDYKIRVTSTSNSAYTDTSNNNFTISTGITVISPNGGENWARGITYTIRWSYSGSPGSYAKIELLKSGVLNRVINSSTKVGVNGSGSYSWPINSTQILGSDYKVRITSTTSSSYTDTSNSNFTISAPSITVTSPNGGETWRRGTNQTIRWNYTGSPGSYVRIELFKGGVFNRTITSNTSISRKYYNWTIPLAQTPGTNYKIKITGTANSVYNDFSNNNFTISS